MSAVASLMIAGQWQPPGARAAQVVRNPATLEPVGAVAGADRAQWQQALAAAQTAAPGWSARDRAVRCALLRQIGERWSKSSSDLARLHAAENGQVLSESLDLVQQASAYWQAEDAAGSGVDEDRTSAPAGWVLVRPDAAQPLLHWARLCAHHLRRGSPCLTALNPAAPLAVLRAAIECVDLPAGVLSVLVGEPEWPDGSNPAPCAAAPAPAGEVVQDIVHVAADADLGLAVAAAAALRLYNSGQRAQQSVRVYVEQPVIYRLADRLHEHMALLEVGDPVRPGTDLGPLSSAARLQRVEEQVAQALRHGALLKLGGRRYQPWGLTGHFFQPTLLIEGREGEQAPDDQVLGPVIILTPVRSVAETLAARSQQRPLRMALVSADARRALACLGPTDADRTVQDYRLAPWRQEARLRSGHVHIDWIRAPGSDWLPHSTRGGTAGPA